MVRAPFVTHLTMSLNEFCGHFPLSQAILESVNNHLKDSSHAGAKECQQNCQDELK